MKSIKGSKHDKFEVPGSGKVTMVPRHKVLNKYTAGSIIEFLLENGYGLEEIEKALKAKLGK